MPPATPTPPARREWVSSRDFFARLNWIDGTPLPDVIEPYRWRIFDRFLDERDANGEFGPRGRLRFNLALCGRAKKNWKTADLVLASLFALLANDSPGGNQCYLLANDEGQAGDDLSLAKKLIAANERRVGRLVLVQKKEIVRRDGKGFLQILPAQDVVGAHGKTARFIGWDEIHGFRSWDILEALQPDPTRLDAQQMITSYASIYHRPGVPLFDLYQVGRTFKDPRMLFSWYGGDFTNDQDFVSADPETRANPSRASWADQRYLEQQRLRLPSHKYRRLHLNLPGLPEGSAFSAEPVMDAVARGVAMREPEPGVTYVAAVDMSGGSNDDAVLAIAHLDADKKIIVDRVMNQGPPAPFDPMQAVPRFAAEMQRYGITRAMSDRYAGETFRAAFLKEGITCAVTPDPASRYYERFEPLLNAKRVVLPDVPELEQQLLGLVWRGGKIDHPQGEHDDFGNATTIAAVLAAGKASPSACVVSTITRGTDGFYREGGKDGWRADQHRPPWEEDRIHPHERRGIEPLETEADVRQGEAKARRWRNAWRGL